MRRIEIPREKNVRDKLLTLARQVDTDRGLLTLIWTLRLTVLLGLTAYFAVNQSSYGEPLWFQIKLALLAFFVYVVASGVGGIYHPEWLLSHKVKLVQVVIEIELYSLFYYLTKDSHSEVYFLYFLPLYIAVRYLSTQWALATLGLASVNLYIVLGNIATSFGIHPVIQTYLPQEFFLVGMTLFYALRRRSSVLADLQEEKSQLVSTFKGFMDGVYVVDKEQRLLFVNDVLRSQHGPYTSGQPCASYFMCEVQLCGWSQATERLADPYMDIQERRGIFIDRDGHSYQVEISSCPLPDESRQIVGAIAFVRDVSKQKQLEQRLVERLQQFAKRVQALTSERAKWLETYYEMGKRLAGFGDLQELMQFVVNETKDRLNAETSALFLLETDKLMRKALAGVESNWFSDESYRVGEGITGQAIVPQNGAKYGKPIKANDVDKNPSVIPLHLAKYKEKLDTHEVKHLIAVPLNGQERSFGVLRVVNKLDSKGQLFVKGFHQEDVDFLMAIASMAAIAIENTRLLDEATQRLQEISTLYTVGQRITQTLDLRELLHVIVDEARKALPTVRKVAIHLIDDRTGMLISEAVSEPVDLTSGLPPLHSSEGIAGRAIKERQMVYVAHTRRDPDFRDRGPTLLSLVVTPLVVGDKVKGTLSADSDQPDAFTFDDRRLLDALATHAATAIEKAQLYKGEQQKRRIADTLREVSRVVNSSLDQEEVLQHVLNGLGKVVVYDSASIQLVDENQLKIIACRGFDDPNKVMKLTFPIDNPKFPNYQVIVHKAPYIVEDVRLSYPHFVEEAEKYHSVRIRSWLGIPLIHRDRVIGMISLDRETPNYYTDDDTSLAMTFGNHVAIAIENARLFKEMQQRMGELDTLHQTSQVITSSLDIQEVLGKIVSLAGEVANSDCTGVVLVGQDGNLVTSVEDHEMGDPLHVRARSDGITRQVINTARSITFDKVRSDGVTHNPAIIKKGFKSYVGVPIITRGRVRGVLFVHSFKPGAFRSQGPLLHTFCNQAAIAIENAESFRTAANQAVMFTKLVEISSGLIEHIGLQELFQFCAKSGATIFDVEDCSLYVKNEERQAVDLVASSGIPGHVWPKREASIEGPGLTAYVARTGETLNLAGDEFQAHEAWAGRYEEPFLEHLEYLPSKKCHSLLMGPLVDSQGNYVGVLKLENICGEGAGKRFSTFKEVMHKTFASQIGVAIERARLYEKLNEEASRKARESLSDDLHDIMNVLHGTLILGMAYSKELITRGNYEAVLSQLDIMMKAAKNIREGLQWIRRDVRDPILQEKGLISALKHYTSMLRIPGTFKTIGRAQLSAEIEYALYKIAQEALNNVAKHAGIDEKRGIVEVTLDKATESFQLSINDNGIGFNPDTVLNRSDAFGFQSIDRWAKSIGAEWKVLSQPSTGTRVCVSGRLK